MKDDLGELIRTLCPNGIEYKRLGELCSLVTKQTGFDYTNTIKKKLLTQEEPDSVPYIQTKFFSGKVFDYHTDYYVPSDIVASFPKITLDSKCLLFSIVGASIGNVGLFPGDKKCFLGGAICVAKLLPEYNAEYVFYCAESECVQKQIAKKTKGPQATITVENVRDFIIPFPPRDVQDEIVRIMDNYAQQNSQLVSELSKELEARKIQYNYYRSQIITRRTERIKPCRIKDICIMTCSGGTPKTTNSAYYGGNIPWLRTQEVDWKDVYDTEIKITEEGLANSSAKLIPPNCVIVAMYGATAGKTAINKVALSTNQACCNLQIDPSIAHYRYVYYWLCNDYLKLKTLGRGSQNNLNADMVKNFPIVVPSLDVQEKIIAELDEYAEKELEYEELIMKEVELRQIQFKYYRDKLLSFN